MNRVGFVTTFIIFWSAMLTLGWFAGATYLIVTGVWIAGVAMLVAFFGGLFTLMWAALST